MRPAEQIPVRADARPASRTPMLYLGIALSVLAVIGLGLWLDAAIGRFRDSIAFDGRTADPRPVAFEIGGNRLAVPTNMLRFPEARHGGRVERIDLVLHWPDLDGFGEANADAFRKDGPEAQLIRLAIHLRQDDSDTTGRLDALYARFFSDQAWAGPGGLVGVRLSEDSGYAGEDLFFEPESAAPFVARCLAEGNPEIPATCLREIHYGEDLAVLYRFDKALLASWAELEPALRIRLEAFRRP